MVAARRRPVGVMQVGIGDTGAAVARQIAGRAGLRIVGAVDLDPAKVGRDVGDLAGTDRAVRVRVTSDLKTAVKAGKPDVAVLCAGSSIKGVLPQIEQLLRLRVPIVSTAAELAYPAKGNLAYARVIHRMARTARVAVLGTGVNPGFAMDALPIVLTGACERVDAIRVERVEDARTRPMSFQQRIGAGLTRAQFQTKVDDGSVRHVGLTESISMIADALGWRLDRITETIQPRMAIQTVASELLAVDPGYVSGIVQDGVGYRSGQPVIALHLEAYLGAPEPRDKVEIAGSPPIRMVIPGGLDGDVSTASLVVNAIPRVLDAAPGLHTMRDMPLPAFFAGWMKGRSQR
jgi:4-hydroxy-tetrahydrodipicolinate reductase